jgi:beta-N-acetylhexosaminidase
MAPRAFISGLSSLTLTPDERAFLREARPWGLILFKRNIQDRAQVTELVREAQHELGQEAPVLIDQEGGRVQRLGPPHWPAYPPGAAYGKIYDRDPAAGLEAARRADAALAARKAPSPIDLKAARHAFAAMMASGTV